MTGRPNDSEKRFFITADLALLTADYFVNQNVTVDE
jgi:hypothetical protein